ncbi:MAG: hypothetical protein V4819_06545 [Verrucomicrobiota bacterium]
MKTIVSKLCSVTLFAALTATTAQAGGSRILTQGRAGYTIIPDSICQTSANHNHRETRVALVMEKPDRSVQFQNLGRAGYRVVPVWSRYR